MARLWSILIGYVLGNLLGAMLLGRFVFHQDPTKVGSGNPGTANVGAVFGKKWGIITCLGDFLKTAVALLLVANFFPGRVNLAYAGLGLILGHCFPVLNKFKGGKGVAVAGLFALIYDFPAGIVTLLIALVLMIIMKNLTVPPLIFIFLFACYEMTKISEVGIILLVIGLIMVFKFRHDLRDFFAGKGKKVDVLYSIKKKLGIKVQ
ncbi:glycerol-3-phosphate acyltransferase [Lactobacillus sp. ESL0731]|uniref:glycerol-3-phosphate acyltransferase n=1 Tax=unclassified Lactobacillus TaxID=2620435 RepID=UPI0023F718ED|nr:MULTISPECIES: glycerol-3-phosphate acyltransferase [unclassified Lactobacillus]WEV50861.1 glycerol-3-phosphate acyltransferase [Lactobacillus sp. ESL0700]WEV61992.1 glycerol-3-phosphate acyltransferase [Lactobacillus sp. ESL0731]